MPVDPPTSPLPALPTATTAGGVLGSAPTATTPGSVLGEAPSASTPGSVLGAAPDATAPQNVLPAAPDATAPESPMDGYPPLPSDGPTLTERVEALEAAGGGAVRYDEVQSLSGPQKTLALTNIGAASAAALSGKVEEAPQNGLPYARRNGEWVQAVRSGDFQTECQDLFSIARNGEWFPVAPSSIPIAGDTSGSGANVYTVVTGEIITYQGYEFCTNTYGVEAVAISDPATSFLYVKHLAGLITLAIYDTAPIAALPALPASLIILGANSNVGLIGGISNVDALSDAPNLQYLTLNGAVVSSLPSLAGSPLIELTIENMPNLTEIPTLEENSLQRLRIEGITSITALPDFTGFVNLTELYAPTVTLTPAQTDAVLIAIAANAGAATIEYGEIRLDGTPTAASASALYVFDGLAWTVVTN